MSMVVFALWRRYIFLQKRLVRHFARYPRIRSPILVGIPNTAMERANKRGLYTPKTENQITCLNVLTTNVPTLNIRRIAMRSIGNPLEIKLSIR